MTSSGKSHAWRSAIATGRAPPVAAAQGLTYWFGGFIETAIPNGRDKRGPPGVQQKAQPLLDCAFRRIGMYSAYLIVTLAPAFSS